MTKHDGDLAARIAAIKQEFLGRVQSDVLPNLRRLRQGLLQAPCEETLRDKLLHAAHDMSGSGAVFGYDDVSAMGRRLEDALRALIRHEVQDTPDRHNEVIDLIDKLDATCVAATRDLKPVSGPIDR
jgi:chemotaxis protein histidine kinase CheA